MSVLFDETNDYLLVAYNAAMTLPDADWSIAMWIKLADNAGTTAQYIFSWGAVSAKPSLNLAILEESISAGANTLRGYVYDSAAGWESTGSGTPGTSRVWQHIAIIRSGTTIKTYVDASEQSSNDATSFNAVNVSGSLYLGGRSDLNAGRFLGGRMADVAKWDKALSGDELTALAGGKTALWYPDSLAWYCPLKTSIAETVVGISITDNSSGIDADHPAISDPPTVARWPWQQRYHRRMHGVSA